MVSPPLLGGGEGGGEDIYLHPGNFTTTKFQDIKEENINRKLSYYYFTRLYYPPLGREPFDFLDIPYKKSV